MIDISVLNKLNAPTKEERLQNLREAVKTASFPPMVPQYINNHIHTTYSFSPYSPAASVYAARMEGLCTAGIIDHDSISGAKEFLEAAAIVEMPVTIGMVQSWALELCAYNIKVNAICPGNYLDGPLWSDPERGLFVQYLEAGKVPGAKTVEDVRRFYEAKVPMNRGCLPLDVARAVMYCVEQKYETGQAIPVTGGQVMLN